MRSQHARRSSELVSIALPDDLAKLTIPASAQVAPLLPQHTLDRTLEAGLDQISHLPGARFASIWLVEGETLCLTASHLPADFAESLAQVPLSASFPAAVAVRARQTQGVPIDQTTCWHIDDRALCWPDTGTLVALPLVTNGQPIGAIAYSVPPEAPTYQRVDEFAPVLATGIALAVDNARLFAQTARNQRELLDVINSSPTGIIAVEGGVRPGRISLSNQAAQTLLGASLSAGEDIVAVLRSVDLRDDRDAPVPVEHWPLLRSLNGEVCTNVQLQASRVGKPAVWLLVDSIPLRDPQGAIIGAVATLNDVSALKESERSLHQYISVIAHELRAPMTVLTGFAQILQRRRENRSPTEVRAIDAIRFNVARLDAMIRDLLDASRLQAHRARIEPTTMDLVPFIQNTIDGLRPVLGDRPVQVQVTTGRALVHADPQRVAQVVTNLLTNAAKFSPEGTPIVVRVEPTPTGARVAITDRGPGIPEQVLPRLFQPFQQFEQPGYPREGLGLGLFIARRLVEAQGGQIGVESRVGQGTTFWFCLPRAQPQSSSEGVA